jgi:hypothetical protein
VVVRAHWAAALVVLPLSLMELGLGVVVVHVHPVVASDTYFYSPLLPTVTAFSSSCEVLKLVAEFEC